MHFLGEGEGEETDYESLNNKSVQGTVGVIVNQH